MSGNKAKIILQSVFLLFSRWSRTSTALSLPPLPQLFGTGVLELNVPDLIGDALGVQPSPGFLTSRALGITDKQHGEILLIFKIAAAAPRSAGPPSARTWPDSPRRSHLGRGTQPERSGSAGRHEGWDTHSGCRIA